MDELTSRLQELREQAAQVRVRALDTNRALIAELSGIWRELNELARVRPEARRSCDRVAADIARLEKLDLALDTEWLAEVKQSHPRG
jgi:uncharacterized coiled-coil DUF342 family protein